MSNSDRITKKTLLKKPMTGTPRSRLQETKEMAILAVSRPSLDKLQPRTSQLVASTLISKNLIH